MSGKSSQRKGANGERELSHLFEKYGYQTKRGQVFNHQSDVVGLPGIHVECKRVEHLNIHQAMAQAVIESDIRADGIPAVFHRRNRTEWLVTMRLDDWMELFERWNDGRQ